MGDYRREEWKAFLEGLLAAEKTRAMEEHLLVCDRCLKQYLSFFPMEDAAYGVTARQATGAGAPENADGDAGAGVAATDTALTAGAKVNAASAVAAIDGEAGGSKDGDANKTVGIPAPTANSALEPQPQFTFNVMKRLKGLEARRKGRAGRQDIFYYATAACLTIMLMLTGVFEGFSGIIPKITKTNLEIVSATQPNESGTHSKFDSSGNRGVIEFGWSDRLLDSTVAFINTMKPKGEEVLD